jgi:thiol-disulfide isomerase/thioredoxin
VTTVHETDTELQLQPLPTASHSGSSIVSQGLAIGLVVVILSVGVYLVVRSIQERSPHKRALETLVSSKKFQMFSSPWRESWRLTDMESLPDGPLGASGDIRNVDMSKGTVLVNLWATWCQPCRAEFPSMVKLAKELGGSREGGKGITMVFVSYDLSWDPQIAFFNQFLGGVPEGVVLLRDPAARPMGENQVANSLWKQLGATAVPETFVVRDGQVTGKMIGAYNWSSREVRDYLRYQPGCSAGRSMPNSPWIIAVAFTVLLCLRRRQQRYP